MRALTACWHPSSALLSGHAVGAAPAVAVGHRLQVHYRAHLPGIEIDGARETHVLLERAAAAEDIDGADHPVIPSGSIVDTGLAEFDGAPGVAR